MRTKRAAPISTFVIVLIVALAAIGVGYGLWSQSLFIRGRVSTGTVSAEFTHAFTDDDGRVDDPALDGGDTADCTINVPDNETSCDPAASGKDPKARRDKNVGQCKASVVAADRGQVEKLNAYPGYFCTAWFEVHNNGSIPLQIASATVDGQPVAPDSPTPFDLNGDNQPDVAIHLIGLEICQQIDPSQRVLMALDQQVLDGVREGSSLNYTVEVQLQQWSDECRPPELINEAQIEGARIVRFVAFPIPLDAFSEAPFEEKPGEDDGEVRPPEQIHPVLLQWLEERDPNERVRVVVNFTDDVVIPRFPEPILDEPRDSAANKGAMAAADRLVASIQAQRAQNYARLMEEFTQYKAEVIDVFWLVNAMHVEVPLSTVRSIASRADVLYIEPNEGGEEPPDANPNNDVDDARALIVSDPYFNLGLTGGWIGLLDTGLRFTHTLFNSPSHIDFRFDCTDGVCNSVPNVVDDCWNHGTSSAAIITGNNNLGNAYRGVTAITLDSFKVYPTTFGTDGLCNGFLNATATVKAFEKAVAVLDRVIVAEMQGGGSDTSTISTAADNAFNAGAVIIAANGNNGPGGSTVNTPAIAHRVIGVGNFDVQSQNQINSQSRGPAPDNRYKPDIQAPTNTETAGNGCAFKQNCTTGGSDTALRVFGGTSGSTPYGAGAAALLRNWLRGTSFNIDPGQVYAQLILSGQNPYPFNNTSGAGPIKLPVNGWAWWGKVTVSNGMTIDIPLNNTQVNSTFFDGALWWPESPTGSHNDIDLYLIDPSGATRDFSWSIPSVFERARATGAIQTGVWKVRIRGYSVPGGTQTVYWAVASNRP